MPTGETVANLYNSLTEEQKLKVVQYMADINASGKKQEEEPKEEHKNPETMPERSEPTQTENTSKADKIASDRVARYTERIQKAACKYHNIISGSGAGYDLHFQEVEALVGKSIDNPTANNIYHGIIDSFSYGFIRGISYQKKLNRNRRGKAATVAAE